MGTPWGYGPKEFTVEGGQPSVVQLNVPHRGRITAINLQQIVGDGDGNFTIYDAKDAAFAVSGSSSTCRLSDT